tara:strand:- start:209 stop:616 length:408 start_codon:yes stop_codon:yes gene_type:complete
VFGVESDFYLTDLSRTLPCSNRAYNCNSHSDWNASSRGRLGYAVDRTLFFATAGYAVTEFKGFTHLINTGQTYAGEEVLDGFAVGGGIERALTNSLLVRAEYRHEEFSDAQILCDVPYGVKPRIDMALFGITWKF